MHDFDTRKQGLTLAMQTLFPAWKSDVLHDSLIHPPTFHLNIGLTSSCTECWYCSCFTLQTDKLSIYIITVWRGRFSFDMKLKLFLTEPFCSRVNTISTWWTANVFNHKCMGVGTEPDINLYCGLHYFQYSENKHPWWILTCIKDKQQVFIMSVFFKKRESLQGALLWVLTLKQCMLGCLPVCWSCFFGDTI